MLRHLTRTASRLRPKPAPTPTSTLTSPHPHSAPFPRKWTKPLLLSTTATASVLAYYTSLPRIHADVIEVTSPTKQSTGVNTWFQGDPPSTDYLLSWNSMAEVPPEETGIVRIESVIIQSNSPSEDFISVALADQMTLCGIFDGHNGPSTSSILSLSLPTAVLQALDHLFSSSTSLSEPEPDPSLSPSEQDQIHESLEHSEHSELGTPPTPTRPSDASIDRAIKSAFLAVDKSLISDPLHAALSHPTPRSAHTTRALAPALSGSCALLSIFEPATRQLRVALTGDSRAVLGRRVVDPSTGKERYEVHVLSEDQNGYNPKEVERMSAAHPGETVSEKGRVMGWGMSRAFGDALTKWSLEDQERVRKECLGDRSYSNIKTPPYFSAEPEITTTQVRKGDFLVMASDGLWESLTSAEAVGLVGVWLKENKVSRKRGGSTSSSFMQGSNSTVGERDVVRPGAKPIERDDLPVELEAEDKTVRYKSWRAEKKFLNVDENVAVHLARNALGGADRDLTGALLALTPPRARRFRDDISVSVVFFD